MICNFAIADIKYKYDKYNDYKDQNDKLKNYANL